MRYFLLNLLFCCSLLPAWGQIQHIKHEVFPLDSVESISFKFTDPAVIETWAADQIMIRTTIRLYNASDAILDHLVENGRYDLSDTLLNKQLSIFAADSVRQPIKFQKRECYEVVEILVYMPESFTKVEGQQWRRKEEGAP